MNAATPSEQLLWEEFRMERFFKWEEFRMGEFLSENIFGERG